MTGSVDRLEGVLESFMADALADDYANVDPEKRNGGGVQRLLALVVFILIGAVLAGALVATLRSAGSRLQTRDALAQRVDSATQALAQTQDRLNAERAETAALQDRVLRDSDEAPGVAAAVDKAVAATGTGPMSGAGISVTLDDAPDAKAGSLNRVLDRDLQDVVNALWQAGATGISINGNRLMTTTAIRAAGDAIVVNYEPMTRPYRIEAVGAQDAALAGSGVQALLQHLGQDYGLISSVGTGDVALTPGEWHEPRYAQPATVGSAVTP